MENNRERIKMERYTKALAKNEKWGNRFLVTIILLFYGSISFPELFGNNVILFIGFLFLLLLSIIYFEWWKGKNLREAQSDDNL